MTTVLNPTISNIQQNFNNIIPLPVWILFEIIILSALVQNGGRQSVIPISPPPPTSHIYITLNLVYSLMRIEWIIQRADCTGRLARERERKAYICMKTQSREIPWRGCLISVPSGLEFENRFQVYNFCFFYMDVQVVVTRTLSTKAGTNIKFGTRLYWTHIKRY